MEDNWIAYYMYIMYIYCIIMYIPTIVMWNNSAEKCMAFGSTFHVSS